ncbi:MAG: hypothetical protein HKN45_07240 [Flavobacteriales bacterium]|nr:hypothetical protein [Flavobacteriales bacterium]
MNRPINPRILIVVLLFFCLPYIALATDAHEEYMAQSACLRKLADLNDILHVKIYNRAQNGSVPIPDVDHGIFASEGATIAFDNSNGYYGISGKDLVRLFEERFELATDFQEPMVFSSLVISDLIQSVESKEMKIGGWMKLAGSIEGENMTESYPFICTFEVDFETEGPECSIKTFEWGETVKLNKILGDFQGNKLHSTEFLDPERSPLVKRGFCSHYALDEVTIPMTLWIESRAWEKSLRDDQNWQAKKISDYKTAASIGMSDLHSALPYYVPLGAGRKPNYRRFKGEEDIDDLIVEVKSNSPRLRQLVQNLTTKFRKESDLPRNEALCIRAWHNLVNEEMSKEDLFFKDLSNASFCPVVKEFELFKFFGYAAVEEYNMSQEHFLRLQGNGRRTVMLHEMNEVYSSIWYDYGKELDTFYANNEAMLALYLGAIFGNNEERLLTVSAKADKMGEPEVATNCLQRVIAINENEGDPDLWYKLALVKAGNKKDPTKDIEIAQNLSSEPSVIKLCAEAKYLILTGRQTEGLKIIHDATKEKKFKKTEDLISVKAETSPVAKTKRKSYKKLIKNSDAQKSEKLFKLGFVDHSIADADDLGLSWNQKQGYYKDAQKQYKKSILKGFDAALGFKKLAETYLSINELEDASKYFNAAIENQARSGSVYFTVSLLNFISNDQENFDKSMYNVRSLRIDEVGNERDQALFRFMDTFSEIRDLKNLSEKKIKKKAIDQEHQNQLDQKTKSIEGKIRNMYALFSPQDSAYAGLCQATVQSIKGYNDLDLRDKKEYRDVNINDEEVIERMLKDSDIELYFFYENEILEQAAKWNDIFKESIYKEIPKKKKRDGMKYLRESKTFKDPYNYL